MPQNEGSGSVMPMVTVPSVDETRDFWVEKLGFEQRMGVLGKDGKLDFVNVDLAGASLMFTRGEAANGSGPATGPVEFYVNVADVDALHARVEKAGVESTEPLTDQWWGDRTFKVTDPNGYRIWFATSVAEAVPPPGTKIV
jgi:uncharacterized glyoxalase superfamily protein PhnB